VTLLGISATSLEPWPLQNWQDAARLIGKP